MHHSAGFGELLRRYRMAAELTQEQLAERAGLSGRGLSDVERGLHASPHADTVSRLAEALGLNRSIVTDCFQPGAGYLRRRCL